MRTVVFAESLAAQLLKTHVYAQENYEYPRSFLNNLARLTRILEAEKISKSVNNDRRKTKGYKKR